MANTTIAGDSEKAGITIIIIFSIYYGIVFLSGFVGNVLIMVAVFKFKHMKSVVNGFLANLALADILFVLFSLFDGLTFLFDEWRFGDAVCRIQSTFVEIAYTISVLTLVAVAVERYVSICYPYKRKRTFKQSLYINAALWMIAFIFCSPLFYGYSVRLEETSGQINKNRKRICANDNWSKKSRLVFYIIHSVLIYLLPLTVMCISHYKISKVLIRQKMVRSSTYSSESKQEIISTSNGDINENKSSRTSVNKIDSNNALSTIQRKRQRTVNRRANIIKLLVVVTAIFFTLWSPFIFIRLLIYFKVHIHQMIWRASQLLILANTAVNCVIYALISPAFKKAFKCLFTCGAKSNSMLSMNYSISRSVEFSESMRKHTTIAQPVP